MVKGGWEERVVTQNLEKTQRKEKRDWCEDEKRLSVAQIFERRG
jgi:hypothetical protein